MPAREDLELLREGLLTAFEQADNAVKAQIAGQLRAVIKDLDALGSTSEVSAADDLLARREARISGSGGAASASRRGQSRRSGGGHRAS